MATKREILRYKLYQERKRILTLWGCRHGLVHRYDDELVERLRNVYYGGIPASVMLLSRLLCANRCYDRSILITLGFGDDDFNVITLCTDGIRLKPEYIDSNRKYPSVDYGKHSVAERIMGDGSRWIYDTTYGVVYEKSLYFLIENPTVKKINSKQDTLEYPEYQDIQNADIERDKYTLPLMLPLIEDISKTEGLYSEELKREIQLLKERVNYDSICQEIHEDMVELGIRR